MTTRNFLYTISLTLCLIVAAIAPVQAEDHGVVFPIVQLTANDASISLNMTEMLVQTPEYVQMNVYIYDNNNQAVYAKTFNHEDANLGTLQLTPGEYTLIIEIEGDSDTASFTTK